MAGFLTKYVVGKLIKQDHPNLDLEHCLNARQRKRLCTVCREVCPKEVYAKPQRGLDWTECLDCNLCASACPSRAIVSSHDTMEKLTAALEDRTERLWFSCAENEDAGGCKAACLSGLPWEYLCCAALEKAVALDVSACASCAFPRRAALLRENLNRVLECLGPKLFAERVSLVAEPRSAPEKTYTRREMMQWLADRSKRSAAKLAPGFLEAEPHGGLIWRALLHSRLNQRSGDGTLPDEILWRVPDYTQRCWNCGVCQAVCPWGALELEEADGGCQVQLQLWKCGGCGLCADLCPNRAMDGLALARTRTLQRSVIARTAWSRCAKCGSPADPAAPDGLCPWCHSQRRPWERTYVRKEGADGNADYPGKPGTD